MLIENSYISYVNLDHRVDRLEHMQNQLSRIGLNAIRTRGLLPSEINDPRTAVMMNRTPGAVGCHFSQVSVIKEALSQQKHAWVMEDDLYFCQDFNRRIEYIDKWMNENEWDVFWLGATFHSPCFWHCSDGSKMRPNASNGSGKDYERTSDERIMRTYGAFCTYAYIVNVNSIEKILSMFDAHLHNSIGIDWLFIKIQPQLKCFAFVPGSVRQIDNKSDIGTGVTNFSGFAKLNGSIENSLYWFQERMEDFNPNTFQWL